MCGITGILNFKGRDQISESRLIEMRDSLWHRGPDGAGLMIEGQIGLAHRRLSIIDIEGGHQPMSSQDRKLWITYNGELYNYRELRSQLQGQGYQFQTNSDTEVILRAYEHFGESCVNQLRGMFAFAIWDCRENGREKFFMARDRLGIKPLYFATTTSELLFGSEIKAILAGNSIKAALNPNVLPDYLASGYVAGNETFFDGIEKLAPGHSLSWSAETGLTIQRYWQLPATNEDFSLSTGDCIDMVREGLKDAVRSHLVSDVPVGLFLSGGIDSSVLAALMAPMVDEPIHTFSIGFSEAAANELDYAQLSADSIGSRHKDVLVTPEQFFEALPKLIWHEDEPIAFESSVPLHILSRLTTENDVKVVMTGEGADELFIGYGYRYRVTALNNRLGNIYQGMLPERLRHAVSNMVPGLPKPIRRYAERTFLARKIEPRELFFENFANFQRMMRQELMLDKALLANRDPFKVGLDCYNAAGKEPLQCMSHADMQTYLVELLMKQDQMSMSASLESRVPFLDHHLVEQVAAIPGHLKLRNRQTKFLLRQAVKDIIPKQILTRSKMGFPVPTGAWFKGPFWPVIEEFVLGPRAQSRGYFSKPYMDQLAYEHRNGTANHGGRLWMLVNVEMWHRLFVDGDDQATIFDGAVSACLAKGLRTGPDSVAA